MHGLSLAGLRATDHAMVAIRVALTLRLTLL